MRPLRTRTAVKKLVSLQIELSSITFCGVFPEHMQACRQAGMRGINWGGSPFLLEMEINSQRGHKQTTGTAHTHICVGLKKRWVKVWKHFWFIKNLKSSKCFQTRPVVYGSKATYVFLYLAWKHLQLQLNRWVCHSSICKVLKCQMKWWCEFCGPKLKD